MQIHQTALKSWGDTPETVGELAANDALLSAAEVLAKAAPSR